MRPGAVTAAAVFVYRLVTVKRQLEDAGVKVWRSAGPTTRPMR